MKLRMAWRLTPLRSVSSSGWAPARSSRRIAVAAVSVTQSTRPRRR